MRQQMFIAYASTEEQACIVSARWLHYETEQTEFNGKRPEKHAETEVKVSVKLWLKFAVLR